MRPNRITSRLTRRSLRLSSEGRRIAVEGRRCYSPGGVVRNLATLRLLAARHALSCAPTWPAQALAFGRARRGAHGRRRGEARDRCARRSPSAEVRMQPATLRLVERAVGRARQGRRAGGGAAGGHDGGQAHGRADPALPSGAARRLRRRPRARPRACPACASRRAARAVDRTGVEMEAMVAAAVAALTVYDMVKGAERGVEIRGVRLRGEARRKSRVCGRAGRDVETYCQAPVI